MKFRVLAAVAACFVVSSCQTANQGQKQWVQIQAGDVWDVADAKCRMFANTQQQGLYAQGSAGFVIGAQLGNAIGNAIRVQEAYTECMTIAGWKQVPVAKNAKVVQPVALYPAKPAAVVATTPGTQTVAAASVKRARVVKPVKAAKVIETPPDEPEGLGN